MPEDFLAAAGCIYLSVKEALLAVKGDLVLAVQKNDGHEHAAVQIFDD